MYKVSKVCNTDYKCEGSNDGSAVNSYNVSHQAEYADGGDLDDHHHNVHNNFVHSVNDSADLLALFAGSKDACAEEDGDYDNGKHISVYHGLEEVIREDVYDNLHNAGRLLSLICKAGKLCAGQCGEHSLKSGNENQTDNNSKCGGEHVINEGLDSYAAYTLEVLKGDNAVGDREYNNGNYQELQKVYIDSADWLEEISGESGVGNKHQTYENTGEHTKEYLRRKGQFLEHKKILLSHILNINESLHSIILHRQLYVF